MTTFTVKFIYISHEDDCSGCGLRVVTLYRQKPMLWRNALLPSSGFRCVGTENGLDMWEVYLVIMRP
jgi:hypothetical protein